MQRTGLQLVCHINYLYRYKKKNSKTDTQRSMLHLDRKQIFFRAKQEDLVYVWAITIELIRRKLPQNQHTPIPLIEASTMTINLEPKITSLDKLHFIINILCPKWPKLSYGNVKPWLHVPVKVHHCSVANLICANAWIVTKSQNMPWLVQWLRCRVKCD